MDDVSQKVLGGTTKAWKQRVEWLNWFTILSPPWWVKAKQRSRRSDQAKRRSESTKLKDLQSFRSSPPPSAARQDPPGALFETLRWGWELGGRFFTVTKSCFYVGLSKGNLPQGIHVYVVLREVHILWQDVDRFITFLFTCHFVLNWSLQRLVRSIKILFLAKIDLPFTKKRSSGRPLDTPK